MVDAGDHREAVFWVIATWARCRAVAAAALPGQSGPGLDDGPAVFDAAVHELTGIAGPADLTERSGAVLGALAGLRATADAIAGQRRPHPHQNAAASSA